MTHYSAAAMLLLSAAALISEPAHAQDFFKGKSLGITVGSGAGGGYDASARLLARHYGRYVPGSPNIVVKNLPGAGGVKAAHYLATIAPKDGTELAATLNTVPLVELLEPGKQGFNTANVIWIGSVASPANVLAVWHTAGAKTVEQAKATPTKIGATTSGSTTEQFPLIANRLLGTKFQVINGYTGAEINLALERGEVDGKGANAWTSYLFQNADWVRDKKIVPLFQVTFERDPLLPQVPTLMELASNDEHREIMRILTTSEAIGRPITAPLGVPAERVQILRRAFDATMKDEGFLADSKKASLDVNPTTGEDLEKMVATMMASPAHIVEKYKKAVTP